MRLLLVVMFFLAGCEPSGQSVPKPLTQSMSLMVHFVNSSQMDSVVVQNGDQPDPRRDGYAVLVGKEGQFTCDIYVGEPQNLGSATQELLGHELLHCLYGNYHR